MNPHSQWLPSLGLMFFLRQSNWQQIGFGGSGCSASSLKGETHETEAERGKSWNNANLYRFKLLWKKIFVVGRLSLRTAFMTFIYDKSEVPWQNFRVAKVRSTKTRCLYINLFS